MDKTGTLTQGAFAINSFTLVPFPGPLNVFPGDAGGAEGGAGGGEGGGLAASVGGRVGLLEMVLSVEHHSNHPIAQALRKFGEECMCVCVCGRGGGGGGGC